MVFLSLAVLVLAAMPLLYYALALYCVLDFFSLPKTSWAALQAQRLPVSILKPVRGMDPEAYENFASFCRLDYDQYELVFGVADPRDPAVAVIERLQRDFPSLKIRLVTPIPDIGTNRKVSALYHLAENATYPLLVMSDSDVRVDKDYLRRVVAPFANAAVGAVTCFYKSSAVTTLASRLNALGMPMESIPGALTARKLEGKTRFAFGWTMVTTAKCLSEIGGWKSIANHHSDDFELGNRLAKAGYEVELLQEPVEMVLPRETLPELLRRELRWSIGLRNVRPAGYWGMILTHGLPWAILAACVVRFSHWPSAIAAAYLLAYCGLRVAVTWAGGVWGLKDAQILKHLWLVPLRDALSFGVWLTGCFRNEIEWRGSSYRVKDRLLVPLGTSSSSSA
jgi:ceramide glucosyltransferase